MSAITPQVPPVHHAPAVLDRAGRLQLPRGFTDALSMRDRVRLDLEADHIGVWPTERPDTVAPQPDPDADDRGEGQS